MGAPTSWNPQGLSRPVMGLFSPSPYLQKRSAKPDFLMAIMLIKTEVSF
jgi:hypothetical protein